MTDAAMLFAAFRKAALERDDPAWYAPGRMTAATLGRANPLNWLGSWLLSPGDPGSYMRGPKTEDTDRELERFAGEHPEALRDVVVRRHGPKIWDDLRRTWANPHTSAMGKTTATVAHPAVAMVQALWRRSNYNPFARSLTLYDEHPGTLQHELGRAAHYEQGAPAPGAGLGRRLYEDVRRGARVLPPLSMVAGPRSEFAAIAEAEGTLERTAASPAAAARDLERYQGRAYPSAFQQGALAATLPIRAIANPTIPAALWLGAYGGGPVVGRAVARSYAAANREMEAALAADRDGDGVAHEGTPEERKAASTPPKNPVLRKLLEAKRESDRRNYPAKHRILRELLLADPSVLQVDSDDGRGILGLTGPGGFRIHAPRNVLEGVPLGAIAAGKAR